MKKSILALCLCSVFSTVHGAEINDVADVVSSTPIFRQVREMRQECYDEQIQESTPESKSYVGPIIGGITGGLLGNQVGHGNGQMAATAGGAIIGTIVGSNVANSSDTQPKTQIRTIQRCRPITSIREVISGYDVIYSYNGKEGHTFMQNQPRQTIRVGVSAQIF